MRGELKTALKRVEDLQVAISGDIDSDSYSDQVECSETAWRTRTSWPAAQSVVCHRSACRNAEAKFNAMRAL